MLSFIGCFLIVWLMTLVIVCLPCNLPFWASFPLAAVFTVVFQRDELKQKIEEKQYIEENKSGSTDYILKSNENPDVLCGTNLDRFFIECVLSNCFDFSKEKTIQKAKNLADKYNLSYPDGILVLFESAKTAHELVTGKNKNEQLEQQKREERKEQTMLIKYAEYYGKEKRRAMLTDKIVQLKREAANLNGYARTVVTMGQEKEHDWATWGGFASGLAGPAAGVATAMELQSQNVAIRAKNEAYKQSVMPAKVQLLNSSIDRKQKAEELTVKLNEIYEKLISNISTDEVMELLNVSMTRLTVSETGTCKIEVQIQTKEQIFLYEDIPAVVDGTILAHVLENGHEIGTAKLTLPMWGVSSYPCKLYGMALFCGNPQEKYTVTFSAYKLWLMER